MNNKKQKIVPNSECILSFSSEKLVLGSSISINWLIVKQSICLGWQHIFEKGRGIDEGGGMIYKEKINPLGNYAYFAVNIKMCDT